MKRGKEGSSHLHTSTLIRRRRSRLEAKRSGLNDVVEEIARGGCNKRKAEMIEKDLNKMKEQLEK